VFWEVSWRVFETPSVCLVRESLEKERAFGARESPTPLGARWEGDVCPFSIDKGEIISTREA